MPHLRFGPGLVWFAASRAVVCVAVGFRVCREPFLSAAGCVHRGQPYTYWEVLLALRDEIQGDLSSTVILAEVKKEMASKQM